MGDTLKLHIVHLSYALARPAYTDPEAWLARTAFVNGVPEQMLLYGRQTVIYNIAYKGEITQNGVKYLFPAFKRWQLVLPFAFNRFIRKLKPDVVVVHGLIFPWQIIMLRCIIGSSLKIVCQHHAERPFKDFRKIIFRMADRYVGAYLFASKQQGEEWVKENQISSVDKVHEVMGTSSIFKSVGKKSGGIYLWIGDLDKNKDPILAARVFSRFASKHNGVQLHMIYQGRQLEDELKNIPFVNLVGKVEHIKLQEWFDKADFIISTSHYEGSGIAVCEAMSCGCVPIVTNIPSFRMMTGNGALGQLFEPGNEGELFDCLEHSRTINTGSESKRVLEYFEENLSFEANAGKIKNVIDKL